MPSPLAVLGRSLRYAGAFPGLAAGSLLALLSGAGLAMAGPLLVRRVIDDGITARCLSQAAIWTLAFLSVELVRAVAEASQSYLLRAFSQSMTARVRKDLFGHVQRLPLGWFDGTPAGEIAARSTSEVAALGEALSTGLVGLFRDTLVVIWVTGLLLTLHPHFGAVVVGCSLGAGIPAILFRRTAQDRSSRAVTAASRMNAVLEENLSGGPIIRLFGLEGVRGARFRSESDRALEVALGTLRTRAFFDGGAAVTTALCVTLILGLGGAELAAGRISAGSFVAFVQYGSYLLGSLRGTAEKAVSVLSGIVAGERVLATLDLAPALSAVPPGAAPPADAGGLEAREIRFGYVPGREVLRGVSFRIRPGERIALVGRTGAGKTTLVRLVARLYDPWAGSMTLSGLDLRSLRPEDFRRRIVTVTQQVSVFRDSVLENVRMGDPRIGRAEVLEAFREIRAEKFIDRLPSGLDALLGEGGVELSTGEKQLLSFARALVRRPEVLLLDEPTANVDPRTEALLLSAMGRVLEGTTSIVIAHRPSTLEGSDRVFLMKEGVLEETSGAARLSAGRVTG